MAYKLAEEDKLCGVIYPTYEGFSPIPKVTCDMLESKCEQTIIVKCGEDSTSESTSTTTSTSQSSSESTSTSESTSQSVSNSESTSVSTSLSTSESTSESVSESSNTENSNTPEEPKPNPEPQPEPVPTIDLLEVLPKVDDKFSKLIVKDGQVVEVPEVSEEDKRAFEDKIINDLKAKLPEGTTVEAVLEGANYEKGSEVIGGKTNYNLKVRATLNGKVVEHTYKVPHTEEAPMEEPNELPDNEETRSLRDAFANLKKDHYIGLLFIDPLSSNLYGPDAGLEDTKFAIEKLKEKFPEYNINYKINTPKITPKNLEDKGEEYLYSITFTVTKGERSSTFIEYMPYEHTTADYL